MSKTLRQIASTISGDLKALNLDDYISYRYIADKFRDKIAYFLRLEARSRELIRDISIWKTIVSVELEEVGTSYCDYIGCNTIKKSKVKIPEAFNTNYGLLLKVLTVDGSRQFTPIKSSDYILYTKMEYGGKNFHYWIEDGYLYIPNVDLEYVKVLIIPKEPIEVDVLNNPCDCVYPLDGKLVYPDYLISLAQTEVMNDLRGRVGIVEDEKGDDNTNIKN
jgi:hypothetical protein